MRLTVTTFTLAVLAALTLSTTATAAPEPTDPPDSTTTTTEPASTTNPSTTLPLCDDYPDHASCVTTTTAGGCTVINGCLPAPCQPARQYCGPPLSTPIDAPPFPETPATVVRSALPATGAATSNVLIAATTLFTLGTALLLAARRR